MPHLHYNLAKSQSKAPDPLEPPKPPKHWPKLPYDQAQAPSYNLDPLEPPKQSTYRRKSPCNQAQRATNAPDLLEPPKIPYNKALPVPNTPYNHPNRLQREQICHKNKQNHHYTEAKIDLQS